MAVEHFCFQLFACQHFGQVQNIVMSAVAVKLQDDRKIRMVSAPRMVSNLIETVTICGFICAGILFLI